MGGFAILDFEEISQKAYMSCGLDDDATLPEIRAYEYMQLLYIKYRCDGIDIGLATTKKKQARLAYEHDCIIYRMYAEGARRQKVAETMSLEIERDGCPICKRMMQIMDGREKRKETT